MAVRVRPGAGRTRVGGRYDGPHGAALIVAVGAPAVDGKATEAVRRALADALGLRPGAVALRLGATSRDKVFTVIGDEAEIATRLASLRDDNGGSHSVHGGPGIHGAGGGHSVQGGPGIHGAGGGHSVHGGEGIDAGGGGPGVDAGGGGQGIHAAGGGQGTSWSGAGLDSGRPRGTRPASAGQA